MSTPSIFRQTVVVDLENGLHLVPCSQIAQLARRFDGEIRIRNGKNSVDAKNVLDLLTLGGLALVLVLAARSLPPQPPHSEQTRVS